MEPFIGPKIFKTRGGLGRRSPNKDGIFGLVAGGVVTAGYTTLGNIVKLQSTDEAIALGFTASYDTTNKILVYRHIKNFFQYNPNGTLYLMLVARGTTLAQMCDKTLQNVYKLVMDESTNREIKVVGVVMNPINAYVPTYTTGIDADVIAALPKAQDLCVTLRGLGVYLDQVVIEGRLDPAMVTGTLYNLRAQTYEYASAVVSQDPVVAALDTLFARYGDVGSALGMLSVRKVSECLGSVDVVNKPEAYKGTETYPLTNTAEQTYLSAAISSGKKFNDLTEAEKNVLDDKGYIFAGRYEGMDGFFFNDSHTAIDIADDYAYIEDNRVWNKAARLLRAALLPVMKGQVEIDPTTGFIPASQIASYEAKGKKKVMEMTVNGEISGEPIILIEPNQNVVGTGKITMALQYVRKGILRKLEGNVSAINPAA